MVIGKQMVTTSLNNIDVYKLFDEVTQRDSHGCDQEWYGSEWQRKSGCGPTTVCNILWYLNQTQPALGLNRTLGGKTDLAALMEDVWEYVTPTNRGIPTTKLLADAALAYAQARGLELSAHVCDMPEEISARPTWDEVVAFLKEALAHNLPVAFLNLCSGDEKNWDPWHWVTVLSMECDAGGEHTFIDVLDGGLIKKGDLSLWYQTTTHGGGFVYFTVERSEAK